MFTSIEQVRAANERAGKFFFSPGTKRFFASKIGRTVYGGRYFVTSEQFTASNGWTPGRKYTIREVSPDGDIETCREFKFQQFDNNREAVSAIKRLLSKSA